MNIDNQPEYLDFNSLVIFLDILDKVYPMDDYVEKYNTPSSGLIYDFRDSFGKEAIKKMIVKKQAIEELSAKITPHQIAEIYALYEFQRQPCYVGIFDSELKRNISELKTYQTRSQPTAALDFIKHFFEKTNLIEYILSSMWTLNMKLLVKELVTKYNLANVPWYDNLVSGKVRDGLSEYNWFESEVAKLQMLTEKSN